MDGSAGLKTAAELVYPHAKIQRCWAHKLRNVSNTCKKVTVVPLARILRKIFNGNESFN